MPNPQGFSYAVPTEYTDGTPLNPADIERYEIGVGTTSGNYTQIIADTDFESGLQNTPLSAFGDLGFGQRFAAVRVVTHAGAVSDWGTEVTFTLAPKVPKPPSNFSLA